MKLYMQYWVESERGWGIRPDGSSIHFSLENLKDYINDIYCNRDDEVPNIYERTCGDPIEIEVNETIYNLVSENKNLRLTQYQLNNLIKLEDILL